MVRVRTNKIVPIILIVLVSVIAIFALVSLTRAVFFSAVPTTPATNEARDALTNTASERKVELTVRGPIVADENFHSYTITVTPGSRTIKTYAGYLGTVIEQKSLPNNVAAYEQLVYALDALNATRSANTRLSDDTRGVCATGKVYEFSIYNASTLVQRLWATSCADTRGTLAANTDRLVSLFKNQIPDVQPILKAVKL